MHPNHNTPPSSPRLASSRSSSRGSSSLPSSPFASPGRPRTYYKSSPDSIASFFASRMSSPAPSTSSKSTVPQSSTLDGKESSLPFSKEGDGTGGNSEGESGSLDERKGNDEESGVLKTEKEISVREIGTEDPLLEKQQGLAPSSANPLPSPQHSHSPILLTHTSIHRLTPCSSCGAKPNLSSSDFVSLLPCGHMLCPACLTQLVNGVSNDPPRPGMCFADGTEVESFEGVVWEDGEGKEDEASEEPVKDDGVREWVKKTCLGSGLGTMEWGGGLATPPSTPGSAKSYRSSSSYTTNFSSLDKRGVVRVDNIPWDIKTVEVTEWISAEIPTLPEHLAPISILCSRSDGRTLSQLYIELPTIEVAQKLVRIAQGKKLRGRPVSVVLATMSELLEHIFPDWVHGFDGGDAREPWREGQVLSIEDVEGLIKLCKMESPHVLKAPERVFFQFLTILLHFPFHQESTYDSKLVALLAKGIEVAITTLLSITNDIMSEEEAQSLLKILFNAATNCPAFGDGHKATFYRLLGIQPPSPPSPFTFSPSRSTASAPTTPPSSPPTQLPSGLRSPTLDRVRNSPSSPSPLRYYTSPPPLAPGGSEPSSPPSPSPMRRPFVGGGVLGGYAKGIQREESERGSGDGKSEEEMRRVAEETGIELELVRAVAKGLKMGSWGEGRGCGRGDACR